MWGQRDEFHFAWKRLKGDFILQARVELVGQGVDPHRKAGLHRAGEPRRRLALRRRRGPRRRPDLAAVPPRRRGRSPSRSVSAVKGADFIQLERRGNTYTMSAARFGEPLTTSAGRRSSPSATRSTSVSSSARTTPTWSSRRSSATCAIVRPAKDGFVPYRDYIGSVLEILDVRDGPAAGRATARRSPSRRRTGRRTAARSSTTPAAASEGRGRLHRFDLATRQSTVDRHRLRDPQQQRPRAVVRRHACSAISDQSQDDGQSDGLHAARGRRHAEAHHAAHARRTSTAGRPTASGSSTPAAATASSTSTRSRRTAAARRSTSPTPRGSTTAPSTRPDGKYIYFNSTRSGTMQIWRMKPDGTDQEQVTNDELQQLVPAHLARRQVDRVPQLPARTSTPADHPYYKQRLPAPDADRGRHAAR